MSIAGRWISRIILLTATALLATGCPNRAVFKGPDTAPAALEFALEALAEENYRKTEEALNWVIFNFPGTREAADAQYWLAESYFRQGKYNLAATELDFYIRGFPYGRYQEEANYKLGLSWLRTTPSGARDQSPMLTAEEILSDFLLLHPESAYRPQVEEALAEIRQRKNEQYFKTAHLYYQGNVYRSALVYFEFIAETLPSEHWEPLDRLKLAICHIETGDHESARALLETLTASDLPPDIRRQAQQHLDRL